MGFGQKLKKGRKRDQKRPELKPALSGRGGSLECRQTGKWVKGAGYSPSAGPAVTLACSSGP